MRKRALRIGIVTQSYYPVRGGIPEIVHHTALELEKRGHEVTIVTTTFTPFDEDRNTNVIRIGHDVTVPGNGAFVNVTVGFRLREKLRAIEAARRFDIVHIHQPTDFFLPQAAVQAFSCPKVGTFHTSMGRRLDYELFERYVRRSWSKLDARIAVSEAARSSISRYFPAEYEIIPNGVDVDRFSPDHERLPQFADGWLTILFVGRMDPRKGLPYLLRAFPTIATQFPKSRLIVVGNGLLRPFYQMAVEMAFRPRVVYTGFVSAGILPRYFASADVFCSPATGGESFGIVLLEAMASGVPIVASQIPGYQDVITNGQEGLLVPPKDPAVLAAAIAKLLRDPDLRRHMGTAGRATAQRYSWEKITRRIEEVYRRVLRRRS